MAKFEIFRSSQITTECDRCGGRVDLIKGGACAECRRVLCADHLYGSWWQRLRADFTGRAVCVACRRGSPPAR